MSLSALGPEVLLLLRNVMIDFVADLCCSRVVNVDVKDKNHEKV